MDGCVTSESSQEGEGDGSEVRECIRWKLEMRSFYI